MTYYEGKEAVTRESDYTDLMHASVCTRIHSKKMCAQEASLCYTLMIYQMKLEYIDTRDREIILYFSQY